jgi:hypothetical protein
MKGSGKIFGITGGIITLSKIPGIRSLCILVILFDSVNFRIVPDSSYVLKKILN